MLIFRELDVHKTFDQRMRRAFACSDVFSFRGESDWLLPPSDREALNHVPRFAGC
jgi:hypothetical protein